MSCIDPGGNMGSWEPLVTTFSSTDQYIPVFYVCFCLKTRYLIYIADPFALSSQPTAL